MSGRRRATISALALLLLSVAPPPPAPAATAAVVPLVPPELIAANRLPEPPAEADEWAEYGDLLERDYAKEWREAIDDLDMRLESLLTGEIAIRSDVDLLAPSPKFAVLRSTSRRLAALGFARARAGDTVAAARCLRANLLLSASTARDAFGGPPSLVARMIASTIAVLACDAVNRSLVFDRFSMEELLSIARTVDRVDRLIPSFSHTVRQERENFLALVEAMKSDPKVRAKLAASGMVDKVRKCVDELTSPVFDAWIRAAETTFPEGLALREKALAETKRLVDECSNIGIFAAMWDPPDTIARTLVEIGLANMNRSFEHHVRMRAYLRGTVVSIGLALARRSGAALPASVAELPPIPGVAYADDPFSGKPFRLLPRSGKPLLYSVGWNGFDDGGSASVSLDKDFVIFDAETFPRD